MMEIFPYVLVRLGGGPFSALEPMQADQLLVLARQLGEWRNEKERRKGQLSEDLLACIRTLADPKARNAVQNVRRDLFNDRPLKPAALEDVRSRLGDGLREALDAYLAFVRQFGPLREQVQQAYARETHRCRRQLQRLAGDENLRKGLVLSSQTLLDSLREYQRKDPAGFRKRELQTEYSLLRYLTRMCTKTSPFSTFNNLALAALAEGAESPVQFAPPAGGTPAVQGHVRLNNNLFRYLKDLFAAFPEIYRRLPLRPNPTLSRQEGHFRYLTNHHNTEAFQRIAASPVVALMLQVAGQPVGGLHFGALVQEVQAYIDAPAGDLEKYVKQLVDYGFFEYDLGVSGTDPDWDLKLIPALQSLAQQQVPHAAALADCLRHIRGLAGQYAAAGVAARQALLVQAYEQFRAVCLQLHAAAGLPEMERMSREELLAEYQARQKVQARNRQEPPEAEAEVAVAGPEEAGPPGAEAGFRHESSTFFFFKPEQMFYEDTTRPVAAQLDAAGLKGWVEKLHALLAELQPFRGDADEKEQMAHFFRRQYGDDAAVDLLTFYEAYYREVKKPAAERENRRQREAAAKAQGTPLPEAGGEAARRQTPLSPRQQATRQWHERARTALTAHLPPGTHHVRVTLADLRALNDQLGLVNPPLRAGSFGAFVQFYQEPDAQGRPQLRGVLNASVPGYGKMMSRFLHLFPGEVCEAVRTWNQRHLDGQSLFVEDCDASYFNANLHPPLMPYEMRVPGGHNTLPPPQQLPVTAFEVRLDRPRGELALWHKASRKRTYVFDLGFQGHAGRSQLFQLLEKFTRADHLFAHPLVQAINSGTAEAGPRDDNPPAGRVKVLPRIVYEDQIVLQRQQWHIPKACLPVRKPHENDADYFLAVTGWRQQLGLADQVFVCIHPNRHHPPGADPAALRKLGRDDYKPQYIDFSNPLLVNLFERLVAKVPVVMKVEEMLPAAGQLARVGHEPFVTEQVIQWYT